jgi:ribonuclease HI
MEYTCECGVTMWASQKSSTAPRIGAVGDAGDICAKMVGPASSRPNPGAVRVVRGAEARSMVDAIIERSDLKPLSPKPGRLDIYTDGSTRHADGFKFGGYAGIMLYEDDIMVVRGRATGMNPSSAELMPVLLALLLTKHIPRGGIRVRSDCSYVVGGFSGWRMSKNTNRKMSDSDVWSQLRLQRERLMKTRHNGKGPGVSVRGVVAHSGVPGNEVADTIATEESKALIDGWFTQGFA